MKVRPAAAEYAPFFAGYVSLVPETDILGVLEAQAGEIRALAAAVAPDRETFAYAPEKWTVRQVVGHMADAERVFGHRAFCISRGEDAVLPSFDETGYVASAPTATVALAALADELALVREVNLLVLRRLEESAWRRFGNVSSGQATPLGIAYIMAGHFRHHLRVLDERYDVRAAGV
ncbi:MAG TPA: DinB family protein [Polyangia bacterium]|jgi:hypothetical protein